METQQLRTELPGDQQHCQQRQHMHSPQTTTRKLIQQQQQLEEHEQPATAQTIQQKLAKLKLRETQLLALEGGDVARGYCSCDEQWTSSSTPTASTSPASSTNGHEKTSDGSETNEAPNGNGYKTSAGGSTTKTKTKAPNMATAAASLRRATRIKQQHHVRFSDEKNFSD